MDEKYTWLPWYPIKVYAKRYDVDEKLIAAIIMVESGNNAYAMRYEPNYRWLYFPENFFWRLPSTEETEIMAQKTSWGYMQVMGAVAREQGFKGYLSQLVDPMINIEHGAILLRKLFQKYWNEPDVIASYNMGSPRKTPGGMYENQKYVDAVSKHLRAMRMC